MGVVLPSKRHLAIFDGDQSTVADRHAVGVAREVLEYLARSAEWSLGVDDPIGPGTVHEPALKFQWFGHRAELAVKGKPPLVESGSERCQELASEYAAENTHR